jgi:hypothetical protein
MLDALAIVVPILLLVSISVFFLFSRTRATKRPLKKGDYVMLRGRYKGSFPGVPTSHALVIERLQSNEATVVFMNTKNQILKEIIPIYALSRAS